MTIRASGLSVSPGEVEIQCSLGVDFSKVVESSTISIDGVAANLPLISGTKSQAGTSSVTLAEPYPATLPPVTNGTGTVVIGADSLEASIGKLQSRADYINAFLQVWDDFTDTDDEALLFPLLNGGQALRKSLASQERKTAEIQADAEAQVGNLKATKHADFEARRELNRRLYSGSGYIEIGKHFVSGTRYVNINQGLWTETGESNVLLMGRDYTDAIGLSETAFPIVNVNGVIFHLSFIAQNAFYSRIKLPEAPTARPESTTTTTGEGYTKYEFGVTGNQAYICHTDAPSGASLTDPAYFTPVEAVSREDLVGFETFLVKLGSGAGKIDVVYPNGLVQNGLNSYEGQPLSNTVMPQGYSAFGEWDTVTKGYGKQWSTMSVLERDVWLNDPANNIYVKDGEYYQWQGRARSIRGLGNDWKNLSLESSDLRFDANTGYVIPQGSSFTPVELGEYALSQSYKGISSNYYNNNLGVFNAGQGFANSVDGQCFFLPICTVTRRNQGAYHPFLNEMGIAALWDVGGAASSKLWHWGTGKAPSNTADCFEIAAYDGSTGDVAPFTGTGFGSIALNNQGRPDNKFYDAIYAGDVIDLRLPARTVSESLNTRAQSYINNSVRGVEGLPIMHIEQVTTPASSESAFSVFTQLNANSISGLGSNFSRYKNIGNKAFVLLNDGNAYELEATNASGAQLSFLQEYGDIRAQISPSTSYYLVYHTEADIKFATHHVADIIGHPVNIKTIMDNYGVTSLLGCRWIPQLPSPSTPLKLNRKVKSTNDIVWHDDGAGTAAWASSPFSSFGYSSTDNTIVQAVTVADFVGFVNYETPAYALEPSNLQPVHDSSLSEVLATNASESIYGSVLTSNTTGFVPISPQNPRVLQGISVSNYLIDPNFGNKILNDSSYRPAHETISLGGTGNGVKLFLHEYVDENNLSYDVIISKQMIYDTTFGDDGKFELTDGVKADMPDNNGNYPIYGTFISKYPRGFVRRVI